MKISVISVFILIYITPVMQTRDVQVFVPSTEDRDSGTRDAGSMPVRFDTLPVTDH
mgnify:CR=1 FL=1